MPARFLIIVLSSSAIFLALLLAATFALDPMGQRRARDPGVATWSGNRSCAPPQEWKPPAFARSRARTIFLGTSRVAWGMDASSRESHRTIGEGFNFAVYGSSMPDAADLAAQLMNRQSADTLIVGLDFGMFHWVRRQPSVSVPARDEAEDWLAIVASSLPSRQALRQTLGVRCESYEFDADNGNIRPPVRSPGDYDRTRDNELDAWWALYATCFRTGCHGNSYQEGLAALRELVRGAVRTRTKLVLFINPLPALHLALIREANSLGRFEQWKRDVATIVSEESAGFVDPIRDFAVFATEVWTNPHLPNGSTDSVAGFVDISHYSKGLGRIVQDRLGSNSGDAFFGVALRPETIEAHLQMDRNARMRWETAHPREFSHLQQRVKRLHLRR